jgi:hypothetical protein
VGVGFDDVSFGNDDDESELLDDDAGAAATVAIIFGICVVTVCLDMGWTAVVLAIYLVATLLSKVGASTSTVLSVEIEALFELIFPLPLLFELVRRSAKEDSHLLLPEEDDDDDDDDDFDTLVGDEIMLAAEIATSASTFCSPEQERWGRFKLERGGDIIDD